MPHTHFSSDHHFNHERIIQYCNRPFANVEEMNRAMVTRWNEWVDPEDTVYYLGDFAFGQPEDIQRWIRQLHGRIVLIKGNHDRFSNTAFRQMGFAEVHKRLWVEVSGVRLFLQHFPDFSEEWRQRAQFHLCGHVHTAWERRGDIINVGADVRGFHPWELGPLLQSI